MIESLSAVTLTVSDMRRAFAFYDAMGFQLRYGGPEALFTSFTAGAGYLNLGFQPLYVPGKPWGRAIFYVDDVDATYKRAIDAGYAPETALRDAEWHERYFHILDPDGHEISFARPIP